MQVRAITKGYYGSKVREPGEVFGLAAAEDFSKEWMAKVEAEKSTKTKSGPAAE